MLGTEPSFTFLFTDVCEEEFVPEPGSILLLGSCATSSVQAAMMVAAPATITKRMNATTAGMCSAPFWGQAWLSKTAIHLFYGTTAIPAAHRRLSDILRRWIRSIERLTAEATVYSTTPISTAPCMAALGEIRVMPHLTQVYSSQLPNRYVASSTISISSSN